jgi:hypothetical protein
VSHQLGDLVHGAARIGDVAPEGMAQLMGRDLPGQPCRVLAVDGVIYAR